MPTKSEQPKWWTKYYWRMKWYEWTHRKEYAKARQERLHNEPSDATI